MTALLFICYQSTTCSRGALRMTLCRSCVVNNSLNIVSSYTARPVWECSLGVLFKHLFTKFYSIERSGCHGNQMEFSMQYFKSPLPYQDNSPPPPPPRQLPPGQLPLQIPPGQLPPRQKAPDTITPWTITPKGKLPPGNSPPGLLPPGQLPKATVPQTIAPCQFPPGQLSPGQSSSTIPTSNSKFLLYLFWDEVIVGFQRHTLGSLPRPSSTGTRKH